MAGIPRQLAGSGFHYSHFLVAKSNKKSAQTRRSILNANELRFLNYDFRILK
jgi:hypothetical protein